MNNNNYKLKYTIMKRTLSIISLFSILLTACVGDPGPPGFDGQDGKVADVISVSNVNFNSPNFDVIVNFDQIYSDEVLLVYRLWDNNTWRLLPQTIIFDDGSNLVYNYDFTQNDVSIFLESSSDLNTLGNEHTQNQEFRVVIVPASQVNGVDTTDLNTVINLGNIESLELR